MPTPKKDLLFDLITSLTKAEKRNFRIYAKKIQQNGAVLFLQLFDYLEKQEVYDINVLLNDLENIHKKQIANLKRHLYDHLMASLRLLYSKKQIALQLREFLDYAEILYGKGLYIQSLKLLSRAKKLAKKNNQDLLHLEIVAFEKRIESRHITRSSDERMTYLMEETTHLKQVVSNISDLANLKLYLQRFFINHGHLKTALLKDTIHQFFEEKIASWQPPNYTFFEKAYYYQSYYWYYYLNLDFAACFKYAQKWANLYLENPNMIEKDVGMYLRATHCVLNTTFFIKNREKLTVEVKAFTDFVECNQNRFSLNDEVQAHLFLYQAQFNLYFLNQQFRKSIQLVPEVKQLLKIYAYQLDFYKISILYYKIAYSYFGAGEFDKAIDYFNKIINATDNSLREDILIYARILLLMAHYGTGNEAILDYLMNSLTRQLAKMEQPDQLSIAIISFFKKITTSPRDTHKQLLTDLKLELAAIATLKEERRGFIFINVNDWLGFFKV